MRYFLSLDCQRFEIYTARWAIGDTRKGNRYGTTIWLAPTLDLARWSWTLVQLFKESIHQLNNGYSGETCVPIHTELPWPPYNSSAANFIEKLNGHPMVDTHMLTYFANGNRFETFPQEAPGSRKNGDFTTRGPLYVTMFDRECRDPVGCHEPQIDDCPSFPMSFQGRRVAANLASTAINIPIRQIDGGPEPALEGRVAHINIVHHPDTICKALYTAAYHVADPDLVCAVLNHLPIVP